MPVTFTVINKTKPNTYINIKPVESKVDAKSKKFFGIKSEFDKFKMCPVCGEQLKLKNKKCKYCKAKMED